jgi:hypothetical protein
MTKSSHLVAAQLRHMDRQEREVNAVFWAKLEDRDIGALGRRIVVSIPPARLERPRGCHRRRSHAVAVLMKSGPLAQRGEG